VGSEAPFLGWGWGCDGFVGCVGGSCRGGERVGFNVNPEGWALIYWVKDVVA